MRKHRTMHWMLQDRASARFGSIAVLQLEAASVGLQQFALFGWKKVVRDEERAARPMENNKLDPRRTSRLSTQ